MGPVFPVAGTVSIIIVAGMVRVVAVSLVTVALAVPLLGGVALCEHWVRAKQRSREEREGEFFHTTNPLRVKSANVAGG